MAEGFYVTNKGIELINAVIPNDGKVEINKAKFGSGGTEGAWNYDISAMVSEEYSKNLDPETDKYKISDTDPKALFLSVVVPAEVSCRINEVGFFDNNDNLIIYGIVRDQTKVQGVKYQYDCWVKFDNVDSANVEIKIISSEYEKVEKLVQDTKQEFDQKIESLESEFDISGYVTQEQWGTLGTTYSTIEKVNAVEKKIDDFTSGSEGGLSEYLKKSEASSTYLNKQVASQTYVAKKEGYDLVSSENVAQITTNKTNIDKKVDKEEGKSLVSDTDVKQITTNKTDIATLKTGKVDKVSGKDLVAETDITQITTNKTDIASLKTGKVDKVEGSSLITSTQLNQIETNKTNITEIQSQLEGVETSLTSLNTRMGAVV